MQGAIPEIREERWEFYGAIGRALFITIYPPFYTTGFEDRYGLHIDVLNTYYEGRIHWFMRTDQLFALAKKVLPIFLKEQWKYYDAWQAELVPFSAVNRMIVETDLSRLSDAELGTLMKKFRESFGPPFITNNVEEPLSIYFQSHIFELLAAAGVTGEAAAELVDQYGQAGRASYIKLAADAYRQASTDEEKSAVLREWHYVFDDYNGVKPATAAEFELLAANTPLAFAAEHKTDGISEDAQALLTVVQIIATIQDVRKKEFLQMVRAAQRFGEEYARRHSIDAGDILNATWQEIEDGTIAESMLTARKNPFCIFWTVSGPAVFLDDEAAGIIQDTNDFIFSIDSHSELKGVCASKGKAVGRAVVVFHPSEFSKVRDGDILITMMTRPEFLPVMHRAAAFICDEGGLTSHAAIVAREMRKPCIVATRVGSRTFKDGDMVEVDATAGIVKKI